MSRIAVVHPMTLLGKELRERLDARPLSWREVQLFSPDEEEFGTLTETGGGAAVVQMLNPKDPEPFSGTDVVFFCGPIDATRHWMKRLGPAVKAVVLSPGAEPEDGDPLIPSIGLGDGRGPLAISPPAGAILLAHLLAPLRSFGLLGATATLIEPASTRGEPALHELFEQTKAMMTFSSRPEAKVLGGQWAFNLGAVDAAADENTRRQLRHLLSTRGDEDLELAVNTVYAGVFHGMSASVTLEFEAPVEVESLRDAWGADAAIEVTEEPERLGPVDAAQSEKLLIGEVRLDPNRPRHVWVWATMDNLTRGGAINALEIAESLLAS